MVSKIQFNAQISIFFTVLLFLPIWPSFETDLNKKIWNERIRTSDALIPYPCFFPLSLFCLLRFLNIFLIMNLFFNYSWEFITQKNTWYHDYRYIFSVDYRFATGPPIFLRVVRYTDWPSVLHDIADLRYCLQIVSDEDGNESKYSSIKIV